MEEDDEETRRLVARAKAESLRAMPEFPTLGGEEEQEAGPAFTLGDSRMAGFHGRGGRQGEARGQAEGWGGRGAGREGDRGGRGAKQGARGGKGGGRVRGGEEVQGGGRGGRRQEDRAAKEVPVSPPSPHLS